MLVGTVILIAGDMAYTIDVLLTASEAVWMAGQFLILAAVTAMASERARDGAEADVPAREAGPRERSGISGILILVSLGAVLLSPLVWLVPVEPVWKSFFSALFVVALVVVLVWITDRFDDTVAYLRDYVRGMHDSRLVAEDWRGAPSRIRAALQSTGLGGFLDEFRDSGARLKRDVLFLGPERLYAPPLDHDASRPASCFLVMPFGPGVVGRCPPDPGQRLPGRGRAPGAGRRPVHPHRHPRGHLAGHQRRRLRHRGHHRPQP